VNSKEASHGAWPCPCCIDGETAPEFPAAVFLNIKNPMNFGSQCLFPQPLEHYNFPNCCTTVILRWEYSTIVFLCASNAIMAIVKASNDRDTKNEQEAFSKKKRKSFVASNIVRPCILPSF